MINRLNEVKRIKNKIAELSTLSDSIIYGLLPSGIAYDQDKVQTTPEDIMPAVLARRAELLEEVKRLNAELPAAIERVRDIINVIDKHEYRLVMIELYIGCKPAKDVASDIGYDVRHVYRIEDMMVKVIERCHKMS